MKGVIETINLDIEDYCHDCPDFEVEDVVRTRYEDGVDDHIITCKFSERCDAIHNYILKKCAYESSRSATFLR